MQKIRTCLSNYGIRIVTYCRNMLKYILKYLKRYPLSILTFCAIVYLSLFKPSDGMKLQLFEGMDKVAHFCMYAGLSFIIWFEFFRVHEKRNSFKAFLAMFLIPLIFSGVMEILQSELTTYRSADILDFLFNIAGVVFANIICFFVVRPMIDKRLKRRE